MTIYTKPDELPAWAESGDKIQPSNAEIQIGWPNSNVPPSRQRFNWVLNWLMNGVRYFMQRSIAEWDATEDYPIYAFTQFGGLTYRSINGTGNTNQQPDTAPTFWERWGYSFSQIQPRVDLQAAIEVTTADVILNATQAEAGILLVTGALTGNRNIIIPSASRRYTVINSTSGAFTLGVKTASGAAVLVGQGFAASLVCDGANNVKLLSSDLTAYAPIASPTFTGNPTAPTPALGDNDTSIATTAFVNSAFTSKIQSITSKIQSITASVAAGALTVGLNPTTLDFRNATLSNGAPNTRVIASALSLVIPSGATLGSVSAQQSRLLLLAIDNAGTPELAIVNIAGGNNLDETGLISTTAISAAATAANIVYSTTARTSTPYRIVGYIESTQATAGTWATAPSTLQGIGGQAFAAMASLGYGQTFQDVTASRVAGTTYTNSTGKPIFVSANVTSTVGTQAQMTVNGVITYFGSQVAGGSTGTGVAGIVPSGATYSVSGSFGTNSISKWFELR